MCPQFVDFDADGYTDIITATYAGSPFLVRGSAAGWQQPEPIVNTKGVPIRLAIYWNHDARKWCNADGTEMGNYNAEGHLVSAAVWDWDDDGDFDLLVGSYGGLLYVHKNEGTPGNAKFAVENEPVMVGGEPFQLEGGLTAPRLIDWNGDGLTDIVTGGFKGGAYLYRNTGAPGAPKFDAATTLIPKQEIPTGETKYPTSKFYVDPVDYDNDGDLDLLVGGYAEWKLEAREMSDVERERLREIDAEMEELQNAMQALYATMEEEIEAAESEEKVQAIYERLMETDQFKEKSDRLQKLWQERSRLQRDPQREAGVWLYRRK